MTSLSLLAIVCAFTGRYFVFTDVAVVEIRIRQIDLHFFVDWLVVMAVAKVCMLHAAVFVFATHERSRAKF